MKTFKTLLAVALAITILISQVGAVFAATAKNGSISGIVTSLTCETDAVTAVKTFLVTVQGMDGSPQTFQIDQSTADSLGLIELTADGTPDCRQELLDAAIGMVVTIDRADILSDEAEKQHPVGAALASFFSEITDYDAIMTAHENGTGFGVIAQVLWLTRKLQGDTEIFLDILLARETGNYTAFTYEEGVSIPQNWGQFRKLILDGEKNNSLGIVMSDREEGNGNNSVGTGNGQRNGNGQGNGGGQDNGNNNHGNNHNDENDHNRQNEDQDRGRNN